MVSNKMQERKKCPNGYKPENDVCVSEPDKRGYRRVLLYYSLNMDDTWKDWSRIAKERFEEHLEREHASDFTDGNVDYHVSEGLLAEENLVTGDIVLNVPPLYWEDGYEEYFFFHVLQVFFSI